MSSLSITQTAFPILDDSQMDLFAQYGTPVRFQRDQVLIAQGKKDYPFIAIKSGTVRIVERDSGVERPITVHVAGNFIGDVDMLTGRSSLFTAIANEEVEAYELCGQSIRHFLSVCPLISEVLLEAFQMRRRLLSQLPFIGVQVIGTTNQLQTSRLREFLYKNHVPHSFYEATERDGIERLEKLQASALPLPVVRCNGTTIGNPSLAVLAECIGISRSVDQELFDLIIVGSGPAGLAAAVYASSEGIKTLVIDSVGPGGQAASSSSIENFIGFPSGLSGSELANRGYLQALKFGTQFIAPITVESIQTDDQGLHQLHLCTGQTVRAKCVLVASGVSYRQLDLPGCQRLEGAGVYYAATSVEARVCNEGTAVVVGGGNSAGQAAMFLATKAKEVKLIIRGADLSKGMSSYLSNRVLCHPKIEVIPHTEVTMIHGDSHVHSIDLKNSETGAETSMDCSALFIFIGAKPHTAWLPESVLLDDKGFVQTGSTFYANPELRSVWKLERTPCDLETTVPGILAAGDVRAGTTKRCGFAVGDGSLAVSCVHRLLSF